MPQEGNALPLEVRVAGPGGTLVWSAANPGAPTDWVHHAIAIDSGSWTVESGSFAAALQDVTDLRIRVRVFDNTSPGIKVGFDNVVLTPVPEPAGLAVLAAGGLGLLRRRRAA